MAVAVIFYLFVGCTVVQILYYLLFSTFLFSKDKKENSNENRPVSVIICAKNEAENLKNFLPSIVNQNYQNFEIVLINDESTDETLEIIQTFSKQYNNIRIVDVKSTKTYWGNKKYALTLGIKASSNDYLLFTDADCKPVSKNWIAKMMTQFTGEKQIILGYGKYLKEPKLVNLLVRYETLLTAIQYFSYAKVGIPYMGVGRNLAYHKSVFYKVRGFTNHMHLKSGDDDLFIQETSHKQNTTIQSSPEAFTISKGPVSFKHWFQQKRRHISTANHYKLKHKLLLGLFFLTKLLFLLLSLGYFFIFQWQPILPFIASYYIITFLVIGIASNKLKEKNIVYTLPFLEFGLVLFQFSIFISNLFLKPATWK